MCGLSQYLIFPTPPGILCHKKPSATQPLLSLTQQRLMLDSKAWAPFSSPSSIKLLAKAKFFIRGLVKQFVKIFTSKINVWNDTHLNTNFMAWEATFLTLQYQPNQASPRNANSCIPQEEFLDQTADGHDKTSNSHSFALRCVTTVGIQVSLGTPQHAQHSPLLS